VIQRKILKAQEFFNQSMNRVLNVSRSRMSFKPAQEISRSSAHNIIMRKSSQFLDSPLVLFTREIINNPRSVGAACPSSRQLAQAVAEAVPLTAQGLVVELGAGTGIVTEALLKRGLAPERLVAIERSQALAEYLRRHLPHSKVIGGDALHLNEILAKESQPVSVIISSLPFRTLPPEIVSGIVSQIDNSLQKNGFYVQFTYNLSGSAEFLPHHFKPVRSKIVWNNLPPARINVYQSEAVD